ncbi:MAG: histidine kinase [Bacteroidota bacterium]
MKIRIKPLLARLAICIIGGTLFAIMFYPKGVTEPEWLARSLTRNSLSYFAIWTGNLFIYKKVGQKISWFPKPFKRLGVGMGLMLFFSALVILIPNYMIYLSIQEEEHAWEFFYYNNLYDFLIANILILGLHSVSFYSEWKKSLIKTEILQKENLESQLATLKSQISPHFLFNSLNVLSTLIHTDTDLADQFINRLSLVYRYLLENKDKEVIELMTEMEFVRSYLFLLETRFQDNLKVNIDIPKKGNRQIPPMSIQMLIENAIKHNVISERKPLHIDIKQVEDYIIISNNLQLRKDSLESTHIGLGNIKKRYEYLTDKPVDIIKDETCFTVKIPLLSFTESKPLLTS